LSGLHVLNVRDSFTASLGILKIPYTAFFVPIAAWNSFLRIALVSRGKRRRGIEAKIGGHSNEEKEFG
jgi:hypothetical protein